VITAAQILVQTDAIASRYLFRRRHGAMKAAHSPAKPVSSPSWTLSVSPNLDDPAFPSRPTRRHRPRTNCQDASKHAPVSFKVRMTPRRVDCVAVDLLRCGHSIHSFEVEKKSEGQRQAYLATCPERVHGRIRSARRHSRTTISTAAAVIPNRSGYFASATCSSRAPPSDTQCLVHQYPAWPLLCGDWLRGAGATYSYRVSAI